MSNIEQNLTTEPQTELQFDRFLNYSFHELRTPLTVIYSYAQIATDKLPEGKEFDRLRRIMGQMLDQSEEMVAMLEEFLEASRLQAHKLRLDLAEIDMHELCQQTLVHLSQDQQARVELKLPASNLQMTLQADGTRLETCLAILLDLGLKITEPPNSVILELKRPDLATAHPNREFVINIIIPGVEVPAAELPYIFEFYLPLYHNYSKLKAGKSGVGLFIARGIVEAHGGTLNYEPDLPGFQIKLKTSTSSQV